MKYVGIIIGLLVIVGAVFGYMRFGGKVIEGPTPPPPAETVTVSVYFIDSLSPELAVQCDPVKMVERKVPNTRAVADAAMRQLLRGPTVEEKVAGLISPFEPTIGVQEGIGPLLGYYKSVSINDGVAVIDFQRDALAYLNSAACMQTAVKTPIIETLKQFESVNLVEFSIDGEIFVEWDA